MSGKRLLPLAAVLVVLVVVALMVKRQPAPTRLLDQVGWVRLVPDALKAQSISGVDMYQGMLPDQVLSLRRQGDGWQVATYFNAPVRPSRIESLLEQVVSLEGELRADRDDLVREFDLEEEQALHLRCIPTTARNRRCTCSRDGADGVAVLCGWWVIRGSTTWI